MASDFPFDELFEPDWDVDNEGGTDPFVAERYSMGGEVEEEVTQDFIDGLQDDGEQADDDETVVTERPVDPEEPSEQPTATPAEWAEGLEFSYGRHRSLPKDILFPWETGVMQQILEPAGSVEDILPTALGVHVEDFSQEDTRLKEQPQRKKRFETRAGACFLATVKNLHDLDHLRAQQQKTSEACNQWMRLLAYEWSASTVGMQLQHDFSSDETGQLAEESLRAVFGTKSPNTLLKRAGALNRFCKWFRRCENVMPDTPPFPMKEQHVWGYFKFLRGKRDETSRGFTNPSEFLETVRFCKHVLGFDECDAVLNSKRLQGLAALERKAKGPTRQAPALNVEQIKKLHAILKCGECNVDRIGAVVMLICVYGRARWSDLRCVQQVELELNKRNGKMILYSKEHKTSAVGLRREQYLPITPGASVGRRLVRQATHHSGSDAVVAGVAIM